MLKVLRMKAGESLILCDGQGHDYSCKFMQANGDTAECQVQEVLPSQGEPNVRVTLYMGLPKGDKMDFIVQKAVELGAVEIVPFLAERSVSRPDAKTLRKKCERWRKIAREAAMQCGRGCVPVVGNRSHRSRLPNRQRPAMRRCFYMRMNGKLASGRRFGESSRARWR